MKIRFIFNPRSGHNSRRPVWLDYTRAFVREHQLDAEVVLTEGPRHATALSQSAVAQGCEMVVAIGGDGTLNEVATGLIGTPCVLGLVPCGSGNGLGRHLGIPRAGPAAFHTLLTGRIRTIDTGLADGHVFVNAMGVGFDAEVGARVNALTRRGPAAYVRTTVGAFFGYRPQSYRIHHGGETLRTEAFLLTVANSDQYGNDCWIAPGARVDDGRLDLTAIRRVSLLGAAPLALRLFQGRLQSGPNVLRLSGPAFTLERLGPGPLHTDGEIHPAGARIEVTVRPASLRIKVPVTSGLAG